MEKASFKNLLRRFNRRGNLAENYGYNVTLKKVQTREEKQETGSLPEITKPHDRQFHLSRKVNLKKSLNRCNQPQKVHLFGYKEERWGNVLR